MANRALILANGQFEDGAIPPLASPVPDGERLKVLLERPDVGAYEVTMLADGTMSEVRRTAQRFFREAGPDDLVLLFVSGHGMKDRRGNLYFVTRDTHREDLESSAVEARYFHERMRDSQASRQVVFIDSCYSGAFAKDGTFKSVDIAVDKADFTSPGTAEDEDEGIAIFTASSGNQVAKETEGQSVFTRHFIDGIETGAADPKLSGWITLEDLFTHIRRQLKREGQGQTPQRLLSRLPGSTRVARNPAASVSLPDDIAARMADRDTLVRASAVDPLFQLANGDAILLARLARDALKALAGDETLLVATAAERALERLPPETRGPDLEEEARLAAQQAALETEKARLEAERRALEEKAAADAEALERQKAEIADYGKNARDAAMRDAQHWRIATGQQSPQARKSGTGKIVALSAAGILGLGIIGYAVENGGFDGGSDYGPEQDPYQVNPPPGGGEVDPYRAVPQPQPQPVNPVGQMALAIAAQNRPYLPQAIGPTAMVTQVEVKGTRLIYQVQFNEYVAPEQLAFAKQQALTFFSGACQIDAAVSQFITAGGARIFQITSANGMQYEVVHDRC